MLNNERHNTYNIECLIIHIIDNVAKSSCKIKLEDNYFLKVLNCIDKVKLTTLLVPLNIFKVLTN